MACNLTPWNYPRADRAYELERIMIGPGKVYAALHPISADTTLQELGLYNRDGVIIRPDFDAREILADQFRSNLRTFVHTIKYEIQFKLQETTGFNLMLAHLAPDYEVDTTTGEITSICVDGDYAEPYMFTMFRAPFAWNDQNWIREIIIPRATVKSVGEMVYKAEEETVLDMTLTANLDFDTSGYETSGILFGYRDVLETP